MPAVQTDHLDQLEQTGRMLGRLHACGANSPFNHRTALTPESHGWNARQRVLDSNLLPLDFQDAYQSTTELLIKEIETRWNQFPIRFQRIHGDFHPGNILYRDNHPLFLDFDDCVTGPRIQDIWMLLSGDQNQQQLQLNRIMKGYRMFSELDPVELHLVESCRSLRIINYAGWLAQRWNDPAFPLAFPWFGQNRFWSDHILQLKEQLANIQSTPEEMGLNIKPEFGYN